MITTLLFDLDDTLLDNDMGAFLPEYMRALGAHSAAYAEPQKFAGLILAGTKAMIENADPARTLKSVFDGRFYPALGQTPEGMAAHFEGFYHGVFPRLRSVTGVRPEARAAMEWAAAGKFQVAIATNPLFPRMAIEERLAWAGVPVSEFAYALITDYERMHFAKPRPEYYAEILARLGVRPEEALMVGDDWENDIVPASAAGLHAFWITERRNARPPDGQARPCGWGSLADFLEWARDETCLETLLPPPLSPLALTALLAGDLAALLDRLADAPAAAWKVRPRPGEWSLTEIICHLRDVEAEVHLPRLRRVASEATPFISAVDSDPWAVERDYQAQDGPEALRALAAARQTTLEFVRAQPPETWARPGRHAIFGPTTFAELVSFLLEHDRLHLKQVRETASPLTP